MCMAHFCHLSIYTVSPSANTVNKDMTCHCREVISTLHKHRGKTRLTGLKLLDAWLGKGKNSLLSRPDGEALLVYMIMQGFLREDFHFTAYTTISYLLPGNCCVNECIRF